MSTSSYIARRDNLETYFDRTAADAWAKMTSDVPLTGIRATVRAGRDRMRATLLNWLPANLNGARILDAGCGTGAFAFEAAKRGADVLGVDLSPTLVGLACERTPPDLKRKLTFTAGDMLSVAKAESFDFCVAMDSLIHYRADDLVGLLEGFSGFTQSKIIFTFAPRTPALALMHGAGRLFPRANRAPSIEPVAERTLRRKLAVAGSLRSWRENRSARIVNGFYTSQAMELVSK
jgi:magnesium-protoporphyrin O-methyltransferase